MAGPDLEAGGLDVSLLQRVESREPFSSNSQCKRSFGVAVALLSTVCSSLGVYRIDECFAEGVDTCALSLPILSILGVVSAAAIPVSLYFLYFLTRLIYAVEKLTLSDAYKTDEQVFSVSYYRVSGCLSVLCPAIFSGALGSAIWMAQMIFRYCSNPLAAYKNDHTLNSTVLANCILPLFKSDLPVNSSYQYSYYDPYGIVDADIVATHYDGALFVVAAVVCLVVAGSSIFAANCCIHGIFRSLDPAKEGELKCENEEFYSDFHKLGSSPRRLEDYNNGF